MAEITCSGTITLNEVITESNKKIDPEISGQIHAVTTKTTLVDADKVLGEDSEAGYAKKGFSILSIAQRAIAKLIAQANTFVLPQRTTTTTLTFGATVDIDLDATNDYYLATTTGAFAINNPTNGAVGQSGYITIDLTDTAPSWGTYYNFGSYGIPSDTTGKLCLHYLVVSLAAGGIIMSYAGGY